MAKTNNQSTLLHAVSDLIQWLKKSKVQGAVIGGFAVSLLAKPRVTKDIDAIVLVPDIEWPSFIRTGKSFGFVPREKDFLHFASITRMILMRHKPSGVDVDLSVGMLSFEEQAVQNAININIRNISIPIARIDDLIVMKLVAGRPRDIADIESMLSSSTRINKAKIRNWIHQFAIALEDTAIEKRLEDILRIKRPRKNSM